MFMYIFSDLISVCRLSFHISISDSKTKAADTDKPIIDYNYLSCSHHRVMVASIALLADFQQLFGMLYITVTEQRGTHY